jgi:hypothetical protein
MGRVSAFKPTSRTALMRTDTSRRSACVADDNAATTRRRRGCCHAVEAGFVMGQPPGTAAAGAHDAHAHGLAAGTAGHDADGAQGAAVGAYVAQGAAASPLPPWPPSDGVVYCARSARSPPLPSTTPNISTPTTMPQLTRGCDGEATTVVGSAALSPAS